MPPHPARSLIVVAAVIAGGCSFTPGTAPGAVGSVDASDGSTTTPVCAPSDPATCNDGSTLRRCRDDGTGFDDVACALGCRLTPAPHCGELVPANGIPVATLTSATAALDTDAAGSLTLHTDTGQILSGATTVRPAGEGLDAGSNIAFSLVAQSGAPTIGVFAFGSLRIAPGTTIRARGTNALAIVASGAIRIDGVLDVRGGLEACLTTPTDAAQCAGPGGQAGGNPNTAALGPGAGGLGSGGPSGYAESGGGGGGHGGPGAVGGTGTTNNTTVGTAGAAFATATLTPLTGGGGGGGGGNEPQASTAGATGGGGGGAVQIVSATSILLGGTNPCGVNAGGGGAGASNTSSGGGGGGAGGGILLEAPSVSVGAECALAANGGGGSGAHLANRGSRGLLSSTRAPGSVEGSGGTRSSGDGGAGGALTGSPDPGENGNDEAGGGGGGIGVIHVRTAGGTQLMSQGSVSPAATESPVTIQ